MLGPALAALSSRCGSRSLAGRCPSPRGDIFVVPCGVSYFSDLVERLAGGFVDQEISFEVCAWRVAGPRHAVKHSDPLDFWRGVGDEVFQLGNCGGVQGGCRFFLQIGRRGVGSRFFAASLGGPDLSGFSLHRASLLSRERLFSIATTNSRKASRSLTFCASPASRIFSSMSSTRALAFARNSLARARRF